MAASTYTPISLYYSTTAAAVPIAGNLTNGELAINITDGKLYYKNNSGVVTLLATAGSTSSQWTTSGSNIYYSAGSVGIGTSSPTSILNVKAASPIFRLETTGAVGSGGVAYNAIRDSTGSDVFINGYAGLANCYQFGTTAAAGFIRFLTGAGVEAVRIDASQNVGIGTSSPTNKLDVTGALGVVNVSSSTGTNYVKVQVNNTGGSFQFAIENSAGSNYGATAYSRVLWNDGAYPTVFFVNSSEKMRLSATGGLSVGTTADPGAGAIYATGNITAYYSDKRLKTVSGKIENALDKVDQLSGVYYTNNNVAKENGYTSDEVQVGVLAQDVEAVLPQIVKAAPFDLDGDGNSKSGQNYKTVQYERLVPLLIEAIKELRAEVAALKGA
jgi:hypothetical protein